MDEATYNRGWELAGRNATINLKVHRERARRSVLSTPTRLWHADRVAFDLSFVY